jgi:hypothetical protein
MASIIDKTVAKALIASYRQQNSASGGTGLLTQDRQFLNGFFIDRASLDTILANPDVVGISVNLARHPAFPTGTDRIFTIVFGGAQPNPAYVAGGTAAPYVNNLDVWDQVEPCPPVCIEIV